MMAPTTVLVAVPASLLLCVAMVEPRVVAVWRVPLVPTAACAIWQGRC